MSNQSADPDIQAVARTSQILALFGPHREHTSALEVAELTGLNRTTAHRYLTSMEKAGLLERDGSTYTVGRLVVQLAGHHLGRQQLMRVAPTHMHRLTSEVRLTSVLSLWGAHGPVVVHTAEDTTRELLLTVPIGNQMDLFAGHSQVWLAFAPGQTGATRLLSMLPASSREMLESLIQETAATGLGVRAIPEAGYVAVAVPIWGPGTLAATLSIVGTPALLPADRNSGMAAALQECAAAISADLGGFVPER